DDSSSTVCFFFSSRRRHTRFSRDWSSDVCSSDLVFVFTDRPYTLFVPVRQGEVLEAGTDELGLRLRVIAGNRVGVHDDDLAAYRSEERRVGKEWRCRWAP